MVQLLIDEAIVLDRPPLSFAWTSRMQEIVARLGRPPVQLDSKHGGHCTVKDTLFLGLPWEMTLLFDATGRISIARFYPPPDPADPLDPEPEGLMPEPLELQVKRHGQSILARREALVAALDAGEPGDSLGPLPMPCPEMRWRYRHTVVHHLVAFSVERGGDPLGFLIDRLEVKHDRGDA